MSVIPATELSLRIALGADETGRFDAGLPVLAGDLVENLFGAAQPAGRAGSLTLFQTDDWLLGAATMPRSATNGWEHAARRVYEDMLQASRGRHLARVWNYVPAINEIGPAGLENYRDFCRGRSLAFERHFGRGFNARLPAASAVGCTSGEFTVVFAACSAEPRHVENPLQVPAYNYPGKHGPRAPSFARATVVHGAERATIFISGTAAIRGHETIASHDLPRQLECTLENLRAISRACGLGPDLDQAGRSTRHFKIYLRQAADQPAVAAILTEQLLVATDQVSYVQADICRASLVVEIEVSLLGVRGLVN
jgi:enamine deaminase RidA (YjgF/YER057c/UK114 family)